MGCDQYTWVETVVDFRDSSGNKQKFVEEVPHEQREKHQIFHCDEYDKDFEDPHNEDELETKKMVYGEKILQEDGQWFCKPHGIDRVKTLLANQKIDITTVVCVYKRLNGFWR